VDLIPSGIEYWHHDVTPIPSLQGIKRFEDPEQEAMAIDGLTLDRYHAICFYDLARRRNVYCSTSTTANLAAIITCASGDQLEDSVEIALLLDAEVYLDDWRTPERATGEDMEGGWTRYYDFILAAWLSVLTGWLSVSPPVIYLTALSSYTWTTGAVDPGSVKQTIFSAALGLRPILRIMVRLKLFLANFLLTHSTSCCGGHLFSSGNFSNFGRPSPGLPISLPCDGFSNRAVVIQMARVSSILVPRSIGCRAS
jgi:hypothetical protein